MIQYTLNVASLVGSRICHDLISPVGAINNGLELISMGGPLETPELQLISDSVMNAMARIKFFRIAFGSSAGEQLLGAPEIAKIAHDAFASGRHQADWHAHGDISRAELQAVFLAMLCIEIALPRGGTIAVTRQAGMVRITGSGPRVACDPALWVPLAGAATPAADIRPAHVQFALLPLALASLGRTLTVSETPEQIDIAF
ncbi:histidine phosphotransferase family protein [Marimonas arenosa]|uniref:Histidine phosphotransferase family protein n=1 Tax=Marimonas arenosa TaxID=1795305 RepID=A0AAE3WA01_9RHOB|nr:histidine phosphotransferase family protein [Marimonas arenosa]MDQ2088680.1 histidine phosphotransferase family protein [Marimonas arenosa]